MDNKQILDSVFACNAHNMMNKTQKGSSWSYVDYRYRHYSRKVQ